MCEEIAQVRRRGDKLRKQGLMSSKSKGARTMPTPWELATENARGGTPPKLDAREAPRSLLYMVNREALVSYC